MKKILVFIFLFQICALYSQEEWMILDLTELTNVAEEVYPIVNEKTGYFATFIRANKQIIGFLYNNRQDLIDTLKIDYPTKSLEAFVGSAYDDTKFTLFFSNSSESKYSALKVDFDAKRYDIIEDLNISNKKENVISYIENNSELHIISVSKNPSVVHRKTLKTDGTFQHVSYDLSEEKFETDNGLPLNLYSLLFGQKSENPFQTINTNVPNSLEQTSALTKIYQNKEHIRITNNTYKKNTYLIDLNINSDNYSISTIKNQNFDKKNKKSEANSFILDPWFFDAYSTTYGITLNVYDVKTQRLNKTFNIIPGDSIAFKNSPIIHDSGTSHPIRDLEKTTRFVRKVNSSNIGIAVYPYRNNYILTLGATHKSPNLTLVTLGGVLGGIVGAAIFSTFDAYGRTESTHIKCIFDPKFEHLTGDIPQNGFDLINNFLKENNLTKATVQTVFKYQDKYIWGYYHKAGKFYRFHTFNSFEK